jgi:hypothetical protein
MKAYKKDDRVQDRDDAEKRGTVTHDMENATSSAWVAWDGGGLSLRNPHTLRPFPHTTACACFDCEEQGFIITDGGDGLERCDVCGVFDTDDQALAAALVLASRCFANPSLPREGTRFEKLVAAIGVAHDRLSNPSTEDDER